MNKKEEEVGDLFVSQKGQIVVKLLPSNKTASMPIGWFADGVVSNHRKAAADIAKLVGQLQGNSRVVRGLTLMTDHGIQFDLVKSGLTKVVEKAGYQPLN